MTAQMLRFGDYRLDAARRELWHGNAPVALPARVFDCIAYLVDKRDRAVGRDELIAAVWGAVDVSDNVLDKTVLRARRALGDEPAAIRTIHGFGYAWATAIETVEPAPTDASDGIAGAPHAAAGERPRWRAGWFALAACLAVMAGTGAWLAVDRRQQPPAVALRDTTVLVLPVAIARGGDTAWVRLGLMDLIAERLRGAGQAVMPSDSAIALAGHLDAAALDPAAVAALARDSGAAWIIAPDAVAAGDGWRISLRVLQGSGSPITLQGEAADLIDAARAASDALATTLGRPPLPRTPATPAERALATVLHRIEAARLGGDLEAARALVDGIDPALRDDPQVILAGATIDLDGGHPRQALDAYAALATRPGASAGTLVHARAVQGMAFAAHRLLDFPGAERYAQQAVELLEARLARGPDPEAARLLGHTLMALGILRTGAEQPDAALADFAQARVLLEGTGDLLRLAKLDGNIGNATLARNRPAEALPPLLRAAERAATLHESVVEWRARIGIARARLALLEPAAALEEDGRLAQLQAAGAENTTMRQFIAVERGRVLAANGRLAAAAALFADVAAEAATSPAADALEAGAWIAVTTAPLALREGRVEQALADARMALAKDWSREYPREYAQAWLTLLRAQLAREPSAAAAAGTIAAAVDWARRRDADAAFAYVELMQAEHAAAAGDRTAARGFFEQALRRADALRVPRDLLEVCRSYAGWLLAEGDTARAGAFAGRATEWADRDYYAAELQLRMHHALGRLPQWHSALAQARRLAGERSIPPDLLVAPVAAPSAGGTPPPAVAYRPEED